VSYPPKQPRRRGVRRPPVLIFLGLALLAGSGFAYWRDTRFPARSEDLAGTPIELRVQNGVKPRELRAVRDGLRLEHRYMAKTLGRTVRGPVEARVAHGSGCRPFQSAGGALIGEGDDGFLCVDTATLSWQWLMLKDRLAATSISAHEYVHVLQAEIGCLHADEYRWIVEGMATDLAWQTLVAAGRVTDARVARTIRQDGAFDPTLEPLSNYEREDGRDQEYALWHLATRRLLREAVADGAAPAGRPEVALLRFCKGVGRGRPWRRAFARSFGMPVGKFYARFEKARQRGAPFSRLIPAQ
jgi:hypothetical protein